MYCISLFEAAKITAHPESARGKYDERGRVEFETQREFYYQAEKDRKSQGLVVQPFAHLGKQFSK